MFSDVYTTPVIHHTKAMKNGKKGLLLMFPRQ